MEQNFGESPWDIIGNYRKRIQPSGNQSLNKVQYLPKTGPCIYQPAASERNSLEYMLRIGVCSESVFQCQSKIEMKAGDP